MKTFRTRVLLLLLAGAPFFYSAQKDTLFKTKKKLTFYASWGYNREVYTKSDIHFYSKGNPEKELTEGPAYSAYDFTIYDAKAHDKSDFDHIASSWEDVINLTIPQFSGRIGFYFNNAKDEGWELNYDHAKYVVTDGQKVHIKGTILGQQVDKDTVFQRQDFHFEHTDGANFIMVNYIKRWKLLESKDQKNNLGFMFKPGAGVVYPRTDVTIFGDRLNNSWHVAGFIAGFETGFRAELFKHLCIEFTGKAAYADYLWCFVHYKGNGQASHHFGTLVANLNVGYQFNSSRPSFKRKKH